MYPFRVRHEKSPSSSLTISFLIFIFSLFLLFSCGDEDHETNAKSDHNGLSAVYEDGNAVEDSYSYVNRPPVIRSLQIQILTNNDSERMLQASARVSDPDGDEASIRFIWRAGGEEIFGASGDSIVLDDGFKRGDVISVEALAHDGKETGVHRAEASFIIPNFPPHIVSEPDTRFEGEEFTYVVQAEDPDGDPVAFTLKNAPKGMTFEPATGLITWSLKKEHSGVHEMQIIATDTEGATDIQELFLTVP